MIARRPSQALEGGLVARTLWSLTPVLGGIVGQVDGQASGDVAERERLRHVHEVELAPRCLGQGEGMADGLVADRMADLARIGVDRVPRAEPCAAIFFDHIDQ